MIRLELTPEELGRLVEAVHLAAWMEGAHKVRKDPAEERFYGIEQKVYAAAWAGGLKDLVDDPEKEEGYFASRAVEDACHEVIDEYDDETFWDELVNRMGERDAEVQWGAGVLERMPPEKRITILNGAEAKYHDEFERHGLLRLVIQEPKKP